MRTALPVVCAFFSGMLMVVAFSVSAPQGSFLGEVSGELLNWVTIIGGFTLALGIVSIVRVNYKKVVQRGRDWPYSLLTLLAVFVMMIPSFLSNQWSPLFGDEAGSINYWLFTNLSSPMQATMFSMLAFYISSAAYRAFRARNVQATLLLVTASIVMIGQVPMGEAFLRIFSDAIPEIINTYIMRGINTGVQRGIIIGGALGAASISLRIMLGIERTYMGRG